MAGHYSYNCVQVVVDAGGITNLRVMSAHPSQTCDCHLAVCHVAGAERISRARYLKHYTRAACLRVIYVDAMNYIDVM